MSGTSDRIGVLHVDDEPDFAEMTASLLAREDERIEVETATSASEGLDRLVEGAFDCIVSDYDMPRMNGIEFLERVREEYPDLPVILFTGKGSEEVASEAISAGVTDYLQKGLGTDQYALLANRIRNAVEAHRARRRATRQEEINSLIRDVNRQLVEADTVEAIEQAVCDTLAGSASYRFAWIGEPDPESGEIVPRTSAGGADSYLEHVTIRYDETPEGQGPGGRAVRTREPQLVQNIPDDPGFDPWRETTATFEYRSVIVLPLVDDDTLHGILPIYADHPYAFGETEREVLEELAETIGRAIAGAKARRRLADREAELRRNTRAMDEAPVGITISDPDREDNPLIYANERFTELTGYDEAEVAGRNCRFLQGDATDPGAVDRMREAIDRGEDVTVELRNYRADGTEFWNRVSIAPVRDDDGELTNWVGFQEDVTERTERERELRRYERIVNTMQEAACIYDADGRFELVNEYLAAFYGTTREALQGEPSRLIPRLRQEADGDPYRELLAGERETVRGVIEAEFPGHGHEVLSYRLTPLRIDGEVDGVLAIAHEITEQRERQRELERKNERLDEFASVVSHDLRSPLNVAEGRLALAREECDSEHLDQIARAHERMRVLIDDLLTLARGDETVTDTEDVRLVELVEACWATVETDGVSLIVDTDRTIRADRSRAKQLFANLLRNAIDHGPEDVTVTVGDLADGFYVADDGPGIAAAEREQIFEAGYSTADDGTGFGLRIVETIASAHGWTITVTDSEAGGARFEVTGVTVTGET